MPSLAGRNLQSISPQQLNAISRKAFEESKSRYTLIESGPLFDRAQCLMRDLAKHAGTPPQGTEWELVVAEDSKANASSLAGGKLILYSGVESIAPGRDDMAFVIATLVSQVMLEQSKARVERQLARQSALVLLGNLGQKTPPELPPENDAPALLQSDRAAIELMARAGYDPNASIRTIERMQNPASTSATDTSQERLMQARTLAPNATRGSNAPACD
ncbi:MAG: hypothetical protein IT473_03790 [Lysobacter sp.]|nr:hypothetical protein [Lysobacter sp.]